MLATYNHVIMAFSRPDGEGGDREGGDGEGGDEEGGDDEPEDGDAIESDEEEGLEVAEEEEAMVWCNGNY